jgi:predicted hotdog family 3-hydroxylacyl-ACP dehydratase
MDPASIPIAELLPHGINMIVIDRLVTYDAKKSVASSKVRRHSKFFDGTGVPAWAGIEYMAQTVAAHAGFEARLHGRPPKIGFLLGTRLYECHVAEFPLDTDLSITVEPLFTETGLGSFNCVVEHESLLARAIISTYQPNDDEIARIKSRPAAR